MREHNPNTDFSDLPIPPTMSLTNEHKTPNMAIINDYLVAITNQCTCGVGSNGYFGAHENGCGSEPLVHLSELPGWPTPVENTTALSAEVDRLKTTIDRDTELLLSMRSSIARRLHTHIAAKEVAVNHGDHDVAVMQDEIIGELYSLQGLIDSGFISRGTPEYRSKPLSTKTPTQELADPPLS